MKAFLLFLSSIFAMLPVCAHGVTLAADSVESRSLRFAFQIETQKAAITGIMLTREDDQEIVGSMVNEFGISAIDFVYTKAKEKVKLVNVVSFLNKWYIKLVLKCDIKFCLHQLYGIPYSAKHQYEVTVSGDTVTVNNSKRHLRYSFSPLKVTEENDTEE